MDKSGERSELSGGYAGEDGPATDQGGWADAQLFRGLRPQSVELIGRTAFMQRVPAGSVLAEEGDRPRLMHILVEGLAQLVGSHDGHETGVAVLSPVCPVMLSSIIVDRPYLARLETLAPSRFMLVPADTVRTVFETDSAFARIVARHLVADERRAMREIKNQKLRTAPERLANWILSNLPQASGNRVRLPFGKHVLAMHVGTTRERLSRSFALLEEHGLAVERRDLAVHDEASLKSFARPQPLIDGDETP